MDSSEHIVPVAETSHDEVSAQFSPDGRWLAYQSNETGRFEVYVVSFPDLSGRRQISDGVGTYPPWSPVGDEFSFWTRTVDGGSCMRTRVRTDGDVFRWDAPRPLFPGGIVGVGPDRRTFVVQGPNTDAWAHEIHVVLNWFEVLREKERG